ncbi:MAG: MBL fold metallo-hydrolase [Methanoregula sp.]|jgi:7,8-dihydropterin-6-yl-methyl-4-(beta-D-ribofuranosyl)aminobenzene 5'-phosphate synthase
MKLTVLADNNTLIDHYLMGESGLSFLIETEGKKLLFDTGYSDVFIRNAQKMGTSLCDLDYIVLSHGHLDHTWGLVHLVKYFTEAAIEKRQVRNPELVAHPWCFYPRPKPPLSNSGSLLTEAVAGLQFPLRLSRMPLWLTKNLVFLGEIDHIFDFERVDTGKRKIVMANGTIEPDQIHDDSALACRTPAGLVIITGCSHAGICNIVQHARAVCSENRVIDIIGGLHLLTPSPSRLKKTGEYLRHLKLQALHACHCTSLSSKIALAGYCPVQEVGTGMKLEW